MSEELAAKARARRHLEGQRGIDLAAALSELERDVDQLADPAYSPAVDAALYCAHFGPCERCARLAEAPKRTSAARDSGPEGRSHSPSNQP